MLGCSGFIDQFSFMAIGVMLVVEGFVIFRFWMVICGVEGGFVELLGLDFFCFLLCHLWV